MKRDNTPVIAADVADALAEWLEAKLPDYKLYQNDLPRRFTRPSVFLELIRATSTPFSAGCTQEDALLTATIFPERDEFEDIDRTAARETSGAVVRALSGGYLMVRDRAVKIQSVTNTPDKDRTFIDVQFRWIEGRDLPEVTAELMEKLNLTIKERRD